MAAIEPLIFGEGESATVLAGRSAAALLITRARGRNTAGEQMTSHKYVSAEGAG